MRNSRVVWYGSLVWLVLTLWWLSVKRDSPQWPGSKLLRCKFCNNFHFLTPNLFTQIILLLGPWLLSIKPLSLLGSSSILKSNVRVNDFFTTQNKSEPICLTFIDWLTYLKNLWLGHKMVGLRLKASPKLLSQKVKRSKPTSRVKVFPKLLLSSRREGDKNSL